MAAGALLLALLGCGGGGSDPVTGITATNFKYGQLATLTLTGNALDNVIKLSSDKCTDITLGAIQSTSTRQASCIVTATGPIQFTVSSSADYVLYQTSLTAPAPVTDIAIDNFSFGKTAVLTLKGDPQLSTLRVTSDKCSNMVLDAVSDSATRTARCTVSGSGAVQLNVTNSTGTTTFYTQTVTVPEPATGITVQNLKYGNTAQVNIEGDPLSIIKVTSDKCINLSMGAVTASGHTATCTVNSTGPVKFTVTNASGSTTLQTQTVSVPEPQVTLVTTLGTVVMELNPTAAPITVKNFLSYVNQSPSFYNGTIFHRVISNFMAQGGGFTTGLVQKTGLSPAIKLESQNGLSNVRGSVAMARTPDADSATAQFFVNLVDNTVDSVSSDPLIQRTNLNYQSSAKPGYAVFGKVVTGMNVVDRMPLQPQKYINVNFTNVPITDITVLSATQTQ
jgi:cyclophilin family peptidyl-prolyl cis-trans isomerase